MYDMEELVRREHEADMEEFTCLHHEAVSDASVETLLQHGLRIDECEEWLVSFSCLLSLAARLLLADQHGLRRAFEIIAHWIPSLSSFMALRNAPEYARISSNGRLYLLELVFDKFL